MTSFNFIMPDDVILRPGVTYRLEYHVFIAADGTVIYDGKVYEYGETPNEPPLPGEAEPLLPGETHAE